MLTLPIGSSVGRWGVEGESGGGLDGGRVRHCVDFTHLPHSSAKLDSPTDKVSTVHGITHNVVSLIWYLPRESLKDYM